MTSAVIHSHREWMFVWNTKIARTEARWVWQDIRAVNFSYNYPWWREHADN